MSEDRFKTQMRLFYAAMFLFIGIFMPYFPVWLKHIGLNETQLATVLAAPLIVRILATPILSALADYHRNWFLMLQSLCWLSFALMVAIYAVPHYEFILLSAVLFGVTWTTVMPLSETIAMQAVKRNGFHYGRSRLWGSAAFILASLVVGFLIDWQNNEVVIYGLVLTSLLTAVMSLRFVDEKQTSERLEPEKNEHFDSKWTAHLKELLSSPSFVVFVLAAGLLQATHAMYYTFGTLHWQSLGYSGWIIGLLWTVGVLAEIYLFWIAAPILKKWRSVDLLVIAGIAAVLRWMIMPFNPPLWALFFVQLLHGLTFGAAHLGTVYYIAQFVEERNAGTAQGLHSALGMGAIMGIATLACGPLYAWYGEKAYLAMAAIACLALLLLLILRMNSKETKE